MSSVTNLVLKEDFSCLWSGYIQDKVKICTSKAEYWTETGYPYYSTCNSDQVVEKICSNLLYLRYLLEPFLFGFAWLLNKVICFWTLPWLFFQATVQFWGHPVCWAASSAELPKLRWCPLIFLLEDFWSEELLQGFQPSSFSQLLLHLVTKKKLILYILETVFWRMLRFLLQRNL